MRHEYIYLVISIASLIISIIFFTDACNDYKDPLNNDEFKVIGFSLSIVILIMCIVLFIIGLFTVIAACGDENGSTNINSSRNENDVLLE